ncbi:MAG: hypothetical protein C4521_00120 [Actinobacteria bacterium]|nr:MAG: hypothetical protein C4521_00120 [Actinomycetota bacterium]
MWQERYTTRRSAVLYAYQQHSFSASDTRTTFFILYVAKAADFLRNGVKAVAETAQAEVWRWLPKWGGGEKGRYRR